MKSRLIVVAVCLLVVMSHVAVAQTPRASHASATAEAPFFATRRHQRKPIR